MDWINELSHIRFNATPSQVKFTWNLWQGFTIAESDIPCVLIFHGRLAHYSNEHENSSDSICVRFDCNSIVLTSVLANRTDMSRPKDNRSGTSSAWRTINGQSENEHILHGTILNNQSLNIKCFHYIDSGLRAWTDLNDIHMSTDKLSFHLFSNLKP
jgi:hypothetical protein